MHQVQVGGHLQDVRIVGSLWRPAGLVFDGHGAASRGQTGRRASTQAGCGVAQGCLFAFQFGHKQFGGNKTVLESVVLPIAVRPHAKRGQKAACGNKQESHGGETQLTADGDLVERENQKKRQARGPQQQTKGTREEAGGPPSPRLGVALFENPPMVFPRTTPRALLAAFDSTARQVPIVCAVHKLLDLAGTRHAPTNEAQALKPQVAA